MPGEPILLERGRYRARLARGPDDVAAALALRTRAFRTGRTDRDDHDAICDHVLIEQAGRAEPVCCYRLLMLDSGAEIDRLYSALFYELSALRHYSGRMVELGRFCADPAVRDPDILRVAWGAMAILVDRCNIRMMVGCTSFPGNDAGRYLPVFARLGARHAAPARWLPGVRADEVVRFPAPRGDAAEDREAERLMPPLLRTYLGMGGWVSDHAVIDREMKTIHVFTAVEVAAIPAARKRLLRAVAAG